MLEQIKLNNEWVRFDINLLKMKIKSSHGWYQKDLISGEIEAKNIAADLYAKSVGKIFLFLLDTTDYSLYNL